MTVGRAVARSNLLKCAIHGEDPNWGRVLSAVGTTDAVFEPEQLAVALNGVWVCRDGAAGGGPGEGRPLRPATSRSPSTSAPATHEATVWTNDLTAAYVHENSAYSHMSRHVDTGTPRWRRPASSSRRCPGSSASTARPSWSSTAATR